MPIITSISPQKNGKRVNIYLDDKFGFGLDLENYVVLGLKVGQEFTTEAIEKIIRKAEFQKTYDKILRFGAMRPRSKKEYDIWLKKHKVPDSLHEELFEKLTHLELLDDNKFAIWWVDQRVRFRNKSKRALEVELRQKGIDKEIITNALDAQNVDEVKMAKKLLEKKNRVWVKYTDVDARRKKSEYLLRNGFSWEIIREVLNKDV